MSHEQLVMQAIEAIEDVIRDPSVDVEQTKESLEELLEIIAMQLDALECS